MTPGQLIERWRAYSWRQEREWERTAWLGRLIASAWVKDVPSVDVLLGRKPECADPAGELRAFLGLQVEKSEDEKFDALWEKVERQRGEKDAGRSST